MCWVILRCSMIQRSNETLMQIPHVTWNLFCARPTLTNMWKIVLLLWTLSTRTSHQEWIPNWSIRPLTRFKSFRASLTIKGTRIVKKKKRRRPTQLILQQNCPLPTLADSKGQTQEPDLSVGGEGVWYGHCCWTPTPLLVFYAHKHTHTHTHTHTHIQTQQFHSVHWVDTFGDPRAKQPSKLPHTPTAPHWNCSSIFHTHCLWTVSPTTEVPLVTSAESRSSLATERWSKCSWLKLSESTASFIPCLQVNTMEPHCLQFSWEIGKLYSSNIFRHKHCWNFRFLPLEDLVSIWLKEGSGGRGEEAFLQTCGGKRMGLHGASATKCVLLCFLLLWRHQANEMHSFLPSIELKHWCCILLYWITIVTVLSSLGQSQRQQTRTTMAELSVSNRYFWCVVLMACYAGEKKIFVLDFYDFFL